SATRGHLDVYLVASPEAQVASTELSLIRDVEGRFAVAYRPDGDTVFIVRPDGYLGYRGPVGDGMSMTEHLGLTFR
ncbi:pentachlorophenol monooxygenase, partial [Streptomyces sp. SID10244]|nr:pentachlorophenol monooxygenase [Streptomyces sp. SID10244]